MAVREVGYLGPIGTYSHLVAEKRYGSKYRMVPLPTILDVCAFVAKSADRQGIIPMENSSGGIIHETVDILLENKPRIYIEEELSLEVRLALIGRADEKVDIIYSHAAPLEHSAAWLKRNYPKAQRRVVASTAAAALRAASEINVAALGSRKLATIYNLRILHYPVQQDVPNLTVFLAVGGRRKPLADCAKTTIAARLPNVPGSLCTFLEAFRNEDVNLCRIISRPIRGSPREYAFLVDVDGAMGSPRLERALSTARKMAVELRVVGSYPIHRPFKS